MQVWGVAYPLHTFNLLDFFLLIKLSLGDQGQEKKKGVQNVGLSFFQPPNEVAVRRRDHLVLAV